MIEDARMMSTQQLQLLKKVMIQHAQECAGQIIAARTLEAEFGGRLLPSDHECAAWAHEAFDASQIVWDAYGLTQGDEA